MYRTLVNKKTLAIIEKFRIKAFNKNRECFESNCHELAIDSHILQKNGIISKISENGHVVECVIDPFQKDSLKFKKTGINNVFTFKGFCKTHDNKLFKEIEQNDFDLTEYRHQLLFAYRSSVNESRKKEVVIDYYKMLMTSPAINLSSFHLSNLIKSEKMGINDSNYTRSILKKNLKDLSSGDLRFYTHELPYFGVCVSGVYTFETSNEIEKMGIEGNPKFMEPLTDVFVSFVPLIDKSILSIGFIKNYNKDCDLFYESLFNRKNNKEIVQHISDLMLLQIENWIISESFYYSKVVPNESTIKSIINWAQKNWDERSTLKINLFE
jgi:hypothetical protein